eukprot:Opistho-1_new@27446
MFKKVSPKSRAVTGQEAEDRALHYLQRQGLRLLERNYRVAAGPSARWRSGPDSARPGRHPGLRGGARPGRLQPRRCGRQRHRVQAAPADLCRLALPAAPCQPAALPLRCAGPGRGKHRMVTCCLRCRLGLASTHL